jgi:intracellular sulfur oxidation DsrE/DsrF family protein
MYPGCMRDEMRSIRALSMLAGVLTATAVLAPNVVARRDAAQVTCCINAKQMEPVMHRRNILAAALAGAGAVFSTAMAATRANAATPDFSKVVYHLDDLDKVAFVFGNIASHYKGMGGPDKVTIALVVLGPALKAFHTAEATADTSKRTDELSKSGLQLNACINTMRAQNVTLKDLLPGFIVAEQGGVVRLAELQSQGFAYLRP